MPEILEIEMYRRGAEQLIGRRIDAVRAPDDWFLKGVNAADAAAALTSAEIVGTERIGKLLLVETTAVTLGLRFGMTGRLVIDGVPIIAKLEYSTPRLADEWVRFGLDLDRGATLDINDPRRLGGVTLDPDRSALGVDAWQSTPAEITAALSGTRRALKAALLDQKRIAGLGNLLVDELCWRCGVNPKRPVDELDDNEQNRLSSQIRPLLDELYERGGSTEGDHVAARTDDGRCPRDGGSMMHGTVGGRSTWWCQDHQH